MKYHFEHTNHSLWIDNFTDFRPLLAKALLACVSIKHHFTFTNKMYIDMFNKLIIMIALYN